MRVVAQDRPVLSLAGDSGTTPGAVTAARFAPMLSLTLYGGRIADRYDERRSLMVCDVVSGVCALGPAVLDLGGAVGLWHVGRVVQASDAGA